MFIAISHAFIAILFAFMLGMLVAFMLMLNAMARSARK